MSDLVDKLRKLDGIAAVNTSEGATMDDLQRVMKVNREQSDLIEKLRGENETAKRCVEQLLIAWNRDCAELERVKQENGEVKAHNIRADVTIGEQTLEIARVKQELAEANAACVKIGRLGDEEASRLQSRNDEMREAIEFAVARDPYDYHGARDFVWPTLRKALKPEEGGAK